MNRRVLPSHRTIRESGPEHCALAGAAAAVTALLWLVGVVTATPMALLARDTLATFGAKVWIGVLLRAAATAVSRFPWSRGCSKRAAVQNDGRPSAVTSSTDRRPAVDSLHRLRVDPSHPMTTSFRATLRWLLCGSPAALAVLAGCAAAPGMNLDVDSRDVQARADLFAIDLTTVQRLQDERRAVDGVMDARADSSTETSQAKAATAARDRIMDALDDEVSDLRAVCEVAFYETPAMMEEMGPMAPTFRRHAPRRKKPAA